MQELTQQPMNVETKVQHHVRVLRDLRKQGVFTTYMPSFDSVSDRLKACVNSVIVISDLSDMKLTEDDLPVLMSFIEKTDSLPEFPENLIDFSKSENMSPPASIEVSFVNQFMSDVKLLCAEISAMTSEFNIMSSNTK